MKVALYARASTERQAERGTIGSQLAVLREQVTAAGHERNRWILRPTAFERRT